MQNRIDRLEGLVLSLMTNGAQSQGPAAASRTLSMSNSTGSMEYPQDYDVDGVNNPNGMMRPDGEGAESSDTDQVAQSLGVLKVFDNKSMYFGEAHWAAILQDVSISLLALFPGAYEDSRLPRLRTISPSIGSSLMSRHRKSKHTRKMRPSHKPQTSASSVG